MSEPYSSASGSYQNYLTQRQADQITQQIKASADKQRFDNAYSTAFISSEISNLNKNVTRMATGIQTSINQNTMAIAASAVMLNETFNEGFDQISNTLDLGFAGVQNSLGTMSATMSAGFNGVAQSINYWGDKICAKLDAIHNIVKNPLLTASRELYRRAYNNATSKFYEEALDDIKSAIEKNKTDYISWGLMGKLYLFGCGEFSNVVDVEKAVESFTNACKYISVDIEKQQEAACMASEFYFYLAYADYILANESRLAGNSEKEKEYFEASVRANAKSYALSNSMLESVYNASKAEALLGLKEKALQHIETAIRKDTLYSIKALSDPDLKSLENEICGIIIKFRDEIYENLTAAIAELENDYVYMPRSAFASEIQEKINQLKTVTADTPLLDVASVFYSVPALKRKMDNAPFDLVVAEEILIPHGEFHKGVHFELHKFVYQNAIITGIRWHSDKVKELVKTIDEECPSDDNYRYGFKFRQNAYGEKGIIIACPIDISQKRNLIEKNEKDDYKSMFWVGASSIDEKPVWEIKMDEYTLFKFQSLETQYIRESGDSDGFYYVTKGAFYFIQKGVLSRNTYLRINSQLEKAERDHQQKLLEEQKRLEKQLELERERERIEAQKKKKRTKRIVIISLISAGILAYLIIFKWELFKNILKWVAIILGIIIFILFQA